VLGVLLGILGTLAFLLFSRVPRTLRRWRPIRVLSDSSSVALSIITQRKSVLYLLVVSLLQFLNVLGVFVIAEGLGVSPEHSVAISICFGLCMTTAGRPGG
jgi:hypothetical protein